MSGGMDFWDRLTLKLIGSTRVCVCSCVHVYCTVTPPSARPVWTQTDYAISAGWSPDSRWFITACIHPRMRVSNGYKVFKYNGTGPVIEHTDDVLYEVGCC